MSNNPQKNQNPHVNNGGRVTQQSVPTGKNPTKTKKP